MPESRLLPEFIGWLDSLKDPSVRSIVLSRIRRLERGLPGDVRATGNGVFELRIHVGSGWRVYFVRRSPDIVILLFGGSKRTQNSDIARASALANRLV